MIYRTWFCLNRHCKHEFTVTDEDNPPCPRCSGNRVQWIPRTTGVISAKTQAVQQTVRQLQEEYGFKNYNSPRMGERAAPKPNPTVPGRSMKFAPKSELGPGWAVDLPLDKDGRLTGAAACAPTGVLVPAKAALDGRVKANHKAAKGLTGPSPNVWASHRE